MTLNDVLDAFGVKAQAVTLLKQSVNTHWEVTAPEGRFALRLHARDNTSFRSIESAQWECDLLRDLAKLGAPVAPAIAGPQMFDGDLFTLFAFAEGEPWTMTRGDEAEYRTLGAMLAQLHEAMAAAPARQQRPGWMPFHESAYPEGGEPRRAALLDALRRVDVGAARAIEAAAHAIEPRLAAAGVAQLPLMPVHGDFSAWNLTLRGGTLSCVFDFDMAHMDTRAADVCFARRGWHDAAVRGYLEHTPLSEAEIEVMDALWLGAVLFGAWRTIEARGPRLQVKDLSWQLEQLAKTRRYAGT